jgi:hypothetical protein
MRRDARLNEAFISNLVFGESLNFYEILFQGYSKEYANREKVRKEAFRLRFSCSGRPRMRDV